jgi:two-component system response regulator
MLIVNGSLSMAEQRILLVEDNEDDAELTVRAFHKCRLSGELIRVPDGESALDYLFGKGAYDGRDVDDVPSLILLDLKLPGISGLDVLDGIRQSPATRRIPTVILSTSDDQKDIATGYDLGVNSYIRKPIGFTSFMDVINSLGLYWLVINTPAPYG